MARQIKVVVLTGVIFLGSITLGFGEILKPESKIVEVTVYPGSALVKRLAEVNLTKGVHSVVFSNIIPEVDENTLTVSGKGTADVKIYGVQVKREYLGRSPSQEIEKLTTEIEKLSDEINTKNDLLSVLQSEKEFLNSIKLTGETQIPKDLMTKFPAVTDLESLSNFIVKKLANNQSQVQEATIAIRDLNRKKNALQVQLQEMSGGAGKMQRSIVVDLEAEKPGDLNLAVSYLVGGVNWTPLYDARTSFDQNKVELVFYGMVKQVTGEPWEDVNLFLSTAKPSISGKMPELQPWYLNPYQVQRISQGSANVFGALKSAAEDIGVQFAPRRISGVVREAAPMQTMDAQVVYTQQEEKGTAVVYEVKRKTTVKADGTEQKVPISAQNLEGSFEYVATPKLSPYAYLMTRVTNAKEGQLLPGKVNIFYEGDYVGSSEIAKSIGAEEGFDLYLGIDEGITVKRKKLEEKVDDTLIAGIPSRTRSTTFSYKLIVENYKSRKVKFHLYDQAPVSENDQIKVAKVTYSVEPSKKDYLDRKGVVRWDFDLEPKQSKDVTLSYTVEHPRDMSVSGL